MTHPEKTSPQDIYQEHLDAVSIALLTWNRAVLLQRLAVPNRLETQEVSVDVQTEAELFSALETQRNNMQQLRVTDFHRICLEAGFTPDGEIVGRHETHLFAGSQRILPPYRSEMVLRRAKTGWQAHAIRSGLRDSDFNVLCPKLAKSAVKRKARHAQA